ncbi:MAG: chorismate mutase [Rickettsiales bacterium]|nr:chorismate mutase [Rickettsiales bacterium]
MEELREKINECDKKIIEALIERFKVAKEIGKYKKANGLPVVDKVREKLVYEKVIKLSEGRIPADRIEKIYKAIIESAVELQVKI